jgi:hypothetical protein
MSERGNGEPGGRTRASDAEREEFAAMVREAVGEGRLTLGEGDDRLATIYAAKFRDELRPLVTDLPAGAPPAGAGVDRRGPQRGPWGPPGRGEWPGRRWSGGPPPRGAFAAHVFVVTLVSAALIGLWALSGTHFFWPAFPLIFFAFSLVRHARWRAYHRYFRS